MRKSVFILLRIMNHWNFIREVCTVVIRKTHLNTVRFLWYKFCGSATVNMAKMRNCEFISVCTHWQNPSLNNQGPWEWERQWQKFFGTSIKSGPAESHNKCDVSRPPDPFRSAWSQEISTFSPADGRVSAAPAVLQVTGYILLCCNLCEM